MNPTASVQTLATGISDLSNAMFVITERRRSTARSALMMVIITSWNGTTAQAMLRPIA